MYNPPPLCIKQPASAFFSFISFCQTLWYGYQYWKQAERYELWLSYKFYPIWWVYFASWAFTYFSSTLFHTHDTRLTEKMDYFGVMLAIIQQAVLGIIVAFGILNRRAVVGLCIPFGIFYFYYMNYMSNHIFDYKWHVDSCITLASVGSAFWLLAMYRNRHRPHSKYIVIALGLMAAFVNFEIFDFPPVLGHFDGHSIWHACAIIISYMWNKFIVADAIYDNRTDILGKSIV
jgi:hypothetical protein